MDLTPKEAFGTGLAFEQDWDVDVSTGGSLGLVDGLDVLGRDLAFGISRRVREDDLRGRRFTDDLRADLRIAVRGVARQDSRVDRVAELTVTEADNAQTTAEVELIVIADTDDRGAFVFTV